MPRITEFTGGDRAGFARLVADTHREFGYEPDPVLDVDLANPLAHYRHIWVLKIDTEVVGSIALTPPRDRVTILKRMYLRPQMRSRGWGRRLLSTAIDAAVRDGCAQIDLDTGDHQSDAQRLYERAGFILRRRTRSTRYYSLALPGTA